jgi:hypothetical protein
LLVVLAVLVLMVTALASLSSLSLDRALAAGDAKIRLQQRLGAASIERALLPRAATIFQRLDETAAENGPARSGAPRQLRGAFTMGGVTFDVLLADEDAKLNLNRVYHRTGLERTAAIVTELVGPAAARAVRLQAQTPPQPQAFEEGDAAEAEAGDLPALPRAFRSWGQVFDLARLRATTGSQAALPAATGQLTCWGSGALNVRRASDAALRAAAGCVLSRAGAGRLLRRYRDNPTLSLELLIEREAKTEIERRGLRKLLGETSNHFSLWLDASAIGRRSRRVFSVMRQTEDGTTVHERFAH